MNYAAIKDLIDVAELEAALNIDVIATNGSEDIARCPLSGHTGLDRNPSFSINREKKLFNCFACGKGGTLVALVADVKRCSNEEAYMFCRTYSAVQTNNGDALLNRITNLLHKEDKSKTVTIPAYRETVLNSWIENVGDTDFFHKRGINDETISLLKLGYDKFHNRGDYTGPAAIIPHFWRGKLVGYQERWLGEKPNKIPKYTNSKDFPRSCTLYNSDKIEVNRDIIVVESAMTVAYLKTLGYAAVATFGASVQEEQIRLIKNLCTVGNKIILSFDNDEAGRGATRRIIKQLKNTVPLFIIKPPEQDKGDLNDLTSDEVSDRISTASPWWATKGKYDGI